MHGLESLVAVAGRKVQLDVQQLQYNPVKLINTAAELHSTPLLPPPLS